MNEGWGKSCLTALTLLVTTASAHTVINIAVDGQMLVKNDRLHFVQGTGSLTVLDVDNGSVIKRVKGSDSFHYAGGLFACSAGILMVDQTNDRLALLDEDSLAPVWELTDLRKPAIGKDFAVVHEGTNTLACFELSSGAVRWSLDMPGERELRAAGTNVLIFIRFKNTYDDDLQVIDAESGAVRFVKTAETGQRLLNVFLDEHAVYLTSTRNPDQIVFRSVPEQLEVFDLNGQLLKQVDFRSPEVIGRFTTRFAAQPFYWNDRLFGFDGMIRTTYRYETAPWLLENTGSRWRRLRSGTLDLSSTNQNRIEFIRGQVHWVTRFRPEQTDRGILEVIEHNGRIIRTAAAGFVECLDLRTGHPVWRYVFPAIRMPLEGMKPMKPVATEYQRTVSALDSYTPQSTSTASSTNGPPLFSADSWTPYPGKFILDPDPDDPFAYVQWLVVVMWVALAKPILFLGVLVWHVRRHKSLTQKWATVAVRGMAIAWLVWLYTASRFCEWVDPDLNYFVLLVAVLLVGSFVFANRIILWARRESGLVA